LGFIARNITSRSVKMPTRRPAAPATGWVYGEIVFDMNPPGANKDLWVQRAPATVGGLAGSQEGVRTWRTDRDGSGWRWFVDDGSAISFRRDVWVDGVPAWRDGAPPEVPCPLLGPDVDPRACEEAAPSEERFLSGRLRLDCSPSRASTPRWLPRTLDLVEVAEAMKILAALEREGVRYVLVGSMGMAVLGIIRATRDIYFFVDHDRQI
jgi:hypothetical protein